MKLQPPIYLPIYTLVSAYPVCIGRFIIKKGPVTAKKLIIPFPLINQRVKYRITIILPLPMGPVNNLG
jgi:hypothetical protein